MILLKPSKLSIAKTIYRILRYKEDFDAVLNKRNLEAFPDKPKE